MMRIKRKKKGKADDEKRLGEIIKQELGDYIKRADLQEYLDNIEKDKRKKRLWDSLSAYKKLKLSRYVAGKKGEQHGKK